MTVELFDNAISDGTSTQLSAAVAPGDTTINVKAAASSILSQQGGQFRVIVVDPVTGNEELMLVTDGAWSGLWTVERGIESTTPLAFPVNSIVRHILTAEALNNLVNQGGVISPQSVGGGPGLIEDYTIDTNVLYRLLLFSNGSSLGIPASAFPPAKPTGLTLTPYVSLVTMSWSTAVRAASYTVYRDGVVLASGLTVTSYTDRTVSSGQTYAYKIQAFDQYGQQSPISDPASAYVDPSLNRAPIVTVTSWPNPIPAGSQAILRINGADVDHQTLAYSLSVDAGNIQPTQDPSVWLYSI